MKTQLRRYGGYALACSLLVGFALSVLPGSPLKPGLLTWLKWLRHIPTACGAVLFSMLQIAAVVLALPATPFNLAAGYLFTVWLGSLISLLSMYTSACLAFLIGRFLARGWVEEQMDKRPAFRSIDAAVANNGFYIVLLVTLAPVFPCGLSCYFFGVTNVGLPRYLLGTALGLIPGTLALTYLGSLMSDLKDIYKERQASEDPTQQVTWVVIALLTTAATLLLLGLATRRTLLQLVQSQADSLRAAKDREKEEKEMMPMGEVYP
eukprot:EG_transcript_12877